MYYQEKTKLFCVQHNFQENHFTTIQLSLWDVVVDSMVCFTFYSTSTMRCTTAIKKYFLSLFTNYGTASCKFKFYYATTSILPLNNNTVTNAQPVYNSRIFFKHSAIQVFAQKYKYCK